MNNAFKLIVLIFILAMNSGCVSSYLHSAIKQLGQQDSTTNNVDEKVLGLIQALRIQQKVMSKSISFSFKQNQSHLMPSDKHRIEKLMMQSTSKIILHIAPATAASNFEKIVLATKRADEVFKLIANRFGEVEIKFEPSQAVDTLIIVLES